MERLAQVRGLLSRQTEVEALRAEADRTRQALDAQRAELSAAREALTAAEAESETLVSLDADVAVGLVERAVAERRKAEVRTGLADARDRVETVERVVEELERRVAAAGHAVANELERSARVPVAAAEERLAEARALVERRTADLARERERFRLVKETGDGVRAEFDPEVRRRLAEARRERERFVRSLVSFPDSVIEARHPNDPTLLAEVHAAQAEHNGRVIGAAEAMTSATIRLSGGLTPGEEGVLPGEEFPRL